MVTESCYYNRHMKDESDVLHTGGAGTTSEKLMNVSSRL